jgi:serine/threonine-protein kinase RsbW
MTRVQARAVRASGESRRLGGSGSPLESAVPGSRRVRTLRLPFSPTAVPQARSQVVAHLTDLGVDRHVVDEAESVVAELVGNAVRHASPLPDGTVRLRWQTRDGVVEIEVTDGGGTTRPMPRRPSWYAVSGRGLRIVRSLAHEWGVISSAPGGPGYPGYTVWASVGGPSRRRAN